MKLKLDIEDMANDFFAGTRLLGVVTSVKDYQFCWKLNSLMRFDFRLNNDIEIQLTRKDRKYYFSVYEYHEQNSFLSHYMYNNYFDGEYLLPEFKHLDFLWLLKGDQVSNEYVKDLQETIKLLGGVQMVTELSNEKVKNKSHLIF